MDEARHGAASYPTDNGIGVVLVAQQVPFKGQQLRMGRVVLVGDQESKQPGSNATGAVVSLKWSLVVAAAGTCALIVLVCATRADGTVVAQIGSDTVLPAAGTGARFCAKRLVTLFAQWFAIVSCGSGANVSAAGAGHGRCGIAFLANWAVVFSPDYRAEIAAASAVFMAPGILRPAPHTVGCAVDDSVAAVADFATGRAVRGCRAAVASSASFSAVAVLVGKIPGPPAGGTAWQLDVLKTLCAELLHQAVRGRRGVRAARGQQIRLCRQLTCELAACLPSTSTGCCRHDDGLGEFWQLLFASTNNVVQDVTGVLGPRTHWLWGPCCGRWILAGTGRKLPIEPRDGSTAFTTAFSSTT